MIVMSTELVGSVSASSEDGAFPADNLLNDKPKKRWQTGGSTSATITASVAAGADQCALFTTNALSATVTIGAEVHSVNLASPYLRNRLWVSYTQQSAPHNVVIHLSGTGGSPLYAGVLRIGQGLKIRNPSYGLQETRRDFSIKRELNNGAWYIRKRPSVRQFSVSFVSDRDSSDFYAFAQVVDYYGPEPFAILLAENIDDHEWAIFGHVMEPFSTSHEYPDHSNVSYTITEAV